MTEGLAAAKTKLVKQGLTIPRLELVSAHMAANLVRNTQETLDRLSVKSLHGWLNSTVTLNWIRGADEYDQFVADQLKKILSNRNVQWRQMPAQENAYYRGGRSGPLKDHKLCWKGP